MRAAGGRKGVGELRARKWHFEEEGGRAAGMPVCNFTHHGCTLPYVVQIGLQDVLAAKEELGAVDVDSAVAEPGKRAAVTVCDV